MSQHVIGWFEYLAKQESKYPADFILRHLEYSIIDDDPIPLNHPFIQNHHHWRPRSTEETNDNTEVVSKSSDYDSDIDSDSSDIIRYVEIKNHKMINEHR